MASLSNEPVLIMTEHDEELLHSEDYRLHFDVQAYLTKCYSTISKDPHKVSFTIFFIDTTVRILYEAKSRLMDNKMFTQKALEFGGGPVVWPSFLLAQYSDSIHFCDYAPCNLRAVSDWINQAPNAHNWSVLFDYVFTQQCRYGPMRSDSVADWEKRLRLALRSGSLDICDVNAIDCPVLNGAPDQYNIIFSSLCLEAACRTDDLYKETIKHFHKLLVPNGLLIMLVVRNQSWYYVGMRRFFCLPINEGKVSNALKEAGFIDFHITSQNRNCKIAPTKTSSDYDGFMAVHAFKTVKAQ